MGTSLIDAIIAAGWAKSKSEAKRHIQSGAIRINDEKCTDVDRILTVKDLQIPKSLNIDTKE